MRVIFIYFLIGHLTYANLYAQELVKRTKVMMGTYVSISLQKDKLSLSSLAFERLKKVELALSSYDENARIYQLNNNYEVKLNKDSYEALVLSKNYYDQTDGYFDISIGSITKGLFHFGEKMKIPSLKELSGAKVNFKGLYFNEKHARIEKGMIIDLGGMGKGFGVDKVVEVLQGEGITRGIIALSGDIFCLHKCEMAIEDPFSSRTLARFSMVQANTAISTSGNYRRYVKNKTYNHLINPKTKRSGKSFASLSLLSNELSNADLDAYATAASVMPRARAFSFLNSFKNLGYLILDNDKNLYVNTSFKTLTKELKLQTYASSHEREYIKVDSLKFQNSKKLRP